MQQILNSGCFIFCLPEKYSRLSTAASDENLLNIDIQEKIQNQTIFGVPIPFTRKSDRTDKYHKVPTADSDNAEQSSDDEMLLDKTLKASQYKRMENEHSSNSGSSNSGTLTRHGQLPTDLSGDDMRPQSCDSNFSGTVTPPASSTENLADPFGAAPFTSDSRSTPASSATTPAANGSIKVDNCPVPLLPNNPFLNDIMQGQAMNPTTVTNKSQEQLNEKSAMSNSLNERNREPSFSDFASERQTTELGPPSSRSIHDFSSIQSHTAAGDTELPASSVNGAIGTVTLPRMQKSKTLDGIKHMSGDNRRLEHVEPTLRRSQTDYEVGNQVQVLSYDHSKDSNDLSDNETLLDKNSGSLRKKDKGRKSPRLSKSSKSPRHSEVKRSLYGGGSGGVGDGGEGYDGALTNEAFSEQDTPTPQASVAATGPAQPTPEQYKPVPNPKPKSIQPHPPTAPKPNTAERRPPVATKPKTVKTPPEPAKKPAITASDMKTPNKDQQSADLKAQSKSETKAAPPPAVKDAYKTHKRYSSYDLATGRAELSLCNETESSKSALVGKEGKTKKKGKIGLGIF